MQNDLFIEVSLKPEISVSKNEEHTRDPWKMAVKISCKY